MIRFALCSEDRTLQGLLSSALGKDFDVVLVTINEQTEGLWAVWDSDLVLLDLDSFRESMQAGLKLSRQVIASPTPLIVLASDALRTVATDLVRQGAYGYCRRPPSIRELKMMLLRAHESCTLRRELSKVPSEKRSDETAPRLIGCSPQMAEVYDLIQRVTNINASVLITGESGTGKELIARGIHRAGIRSERPFVAVSCGAIPESLIEAELFGHEKGAFTGTVGTRVGYLEQAGEGTLFLDEIGELSLSTQVKLLRVLQQREFSRLGSNRLIPLGARLIFATHKNLGEMVAQGRFRQDLYYRINVVHIDAPALREHPEDIPQIAMHFLRQYSESFQRPMASIDDDAIAALLSYSWPGNVRELENAIQRAIVIAENENLRLEDLPSNIREENIIPIDDYEPAGSFERQLRNYKVKLATTALRENNGNKTLAARSLNISRAYLHRLIRVTDPDMLSDSDFAFDGTGNEAESA